MRPALTKPIIFDDAFITSVVQYGESDCIVRMFTRTNGRISAFFKRGFSRRKGSACAQAPALARVGLIDATHKLARMTSCDIDPITIQLMTSLKAFGYAAYFAELIEKFLPEADPSPAIFLTIEEMLQSLVNHGAQAFLLRAFELRLLSYCGYLPEMPNDKDEARVVAFDPVGCRLLSASCENSVPFSSQAVRLAKTMLIAKIGSVNYDHPVLELLMIGRIFQSRLRLMGLGPLKTVSFLKQISER